MCLSQEGDQDAFRLRVANYGDQGKRELPEQGPWGKQEARGHRALVDVSACDAGGSLLHCVQREGKLRELGAWGVRCVEGEEWDCPGHWGRVGARG